MLTVAVMIVGVAIQGTTSFAADKPVDVKGPATASDSAKTAPADNSTQPENTAKSHKSAKQEKKANGPSKKTAEPEKKEPRKQDQPKNRAEETVGEPFAPGMMQLLHDEIVNGLSRRGNTHRFADFQSEAIRQVNSSAGRYTGSELAGNCRLRWYDHMMRNLLAAPAEAERFTRELHIAALRRPRGARQRVGRRRSQARSYSEESRASVPLPTSPEQALDAIQQAITEAQTAYCAALAPLDKSEIQQLQTYLVPVLTTQNQVGHTLSDRGTGRQLCDLMEKMDRSALLDAANALAPIADVRLLEQLKSLPEDGDVKVAGVTGRVVAKIDTPSRRDHHRRQRTRTPTNSTRCATWPR